MGREALEVVDEGMPKRGDFPGAVEAGFSWRCVIWVRASEGGGGDS